jgi:hypothetical protein|tara:strand:- start:179 stop:316 length:138 start_codon:yes stop_codon:yes gene_type:complete
MDIAYLIILIGTNVATYFMTKETIIRQTIDFLEAQGMLNLDDSEK